MILNGAQIAAERLIAHGATTVFGYPGSAVLPLYDALYSYSDRIRHILTAHEQGAAHAADGYARASGRTGVVIATSGPGATNLVTGIANAYLDSVPLVAITGNVPVPLLGKDSFQEVDIAGITQPIVKHSFVVRRVENLEYILDEAFRIAQSGRQGPVLVDIPKCVQSDMCEYIGNQPNHTRKPTCRFDTERVIAAVKNSKRPYIYAGGGVIASGAEKNLLRLSERLSAPVGLSLMGLTSLPCHYPLNLGMSGMHGKYAASAAKDECDLLIALGVRFSDRATGNTAEYAKDKTIIHVDIDNAEIGKNITSHIDICGDVNDVLDIMLKELPQTSCPDWLTRINELKKINTQSMSGDFNPQTVIETVGRYCDPDTVIATDVGQHQMWTAQYYRFRQPRTLLTSSGLGAMGFGLGAAIGGCIAKNAGRTVLFTGDGSFGMNLTELATAVSQKLPIVIVVLNNNALGLPRQWQGAFYNKRYSHSTLNRSTDFAAVARAFGAEGYSVSTLSELTAALENLTDRLPTVIDCRIDIDQSVFPMIPPGGSVRDIMEEE
ncbi:MAG: biosynthetic-type acetolactate synthase large subunit [Oscillospiraceae bacterium]|nr:biosynthetic-type acetolactate synthase large subunit [Oscillospiraceae bacterium]